jgi:hypothetical protein
MPTGKIVCALIDMRRGDIFAHDLDYREDFMVGSVRGRLPA